MCGNDKVQNAIAESVIRIDINTSSRNLRWHDVRKTTNRTEHGNLASNLK